MTQTDLPVQFAGRQNAGPILATGWPGTRFNILIKGYDEPFIFTLPYPQDVKFEASILRMHPLVGYDDWSYGLGT